MTGQTGQSGEPLVPRAPSPPARLNRGAYVAWMLGLEWQPGPRPHLDWYAVCPLCFALVLGDEVGRYDHAAFHAAATVRE